MSLVLTAGGILGSVYAGALDGLDRQGFEFDQVTGTSAGAIVAALVAAGYTPAEAQRLLMETDFARLQDNPGFPTLPRSAYGLVFRSGLYEGEALERWMDELLTRKLGRSPTFQDMPIDLHVVAAQIAPERGTFVFNRENTPTMSVARAVRASAAVPYLFQPVEWTDGEGVTRRFVDGAAVGMTPLYVPEGRENNSIFLGINFSGVDFMTTRSLGIKFLGAFLKIPVFRDQLDLASAQRRTVEQLNGATGRYGFDHSVNIDAPPLNPFDFQTMPSEKADMYVRGFDAVVSSDLRVSYELAALRRGDPQALRFAMDLLNENIRSGDPSTRAFLSRVGAPAVADWSVNRTAAPAVGRAYLIYLLEPLDGGTWPWLRSFYALFGQGLAGRALVPALVESGLFVGGLALLFGVNAGTLALLQAAWHLLHGRAAAAPVLFKISGLTALFLAPLALLDASGAVSAGLLLAGLVVPHFIVNLFSAKPSLSAEAAAQAAADTYLNKVAGRMTAGGTVAAADVERVAALIGVLKADGATLKAALDGAGAALDEGRVNSIRAALHARLSDRKALAKALFHIMPSASFQLKDAKFQIREITVDALEQNPSTHPSILGIISRLTEDPAETAKAAPVVGQARDAAALFQTAANVRTSQPGSGVEAQRVAASYNRGYGLKRYFDANPSKRGLLTSLSRRLGPAGGGRTDGDVIALDLFGPRPDAIDYASAVDLLVAQTAARRETGRVNVPRAVVLAQAQQGDARAAEGRLAKLLLDAAAEGRLEQAEALALVSGWKFVARDALEAVPGVVSGGRIDAEAFHGWIGRITAWNLAPEFPLSILTQDESRWKASRKDFIRVLQLLLPDVAVHITGELQDYLRTQKVLEIQA